MNEYLSSLNSLRPVRQKNNTLVSFFCGGGGLDLGLEFAGFRSVFASDIEGPFCKTVAKNLDTVAEPHDINNLTGNYIRKAAKQEGIDLVAGGPPCQAFSILGQRNSIQDPRGMLVFEYARLIRELSPRAFVFENVPGILTVNKGADWARILKFFKEKTGYQLHWKLLNSANYGVPQIRKRVFIVGFKEPRDHFQFPEPTHFNREATAIFSDDTQEWIPARLALQYLKGASNHDIRIHCDRVSKRYSKVLPGERDRTDHTDRIHPDRPSGTVLVGSGGGGGRPFIHPSTPRHISVREAARLQSFPDWYVFQGTGTQQYRQVGNAVPPLMAYAVGRAIMKSLKTPTDQTKTTRDTNTARAL